MNIKKNVIFTLAAIAVAVFTIIALIQINHQGLSRLLGWNKTPINVSNDYGVNEVAATVTLNSNDLKSTTTSGTFNVAELTFNFDPTKVTLLHMAADPSLLALNKSINNPGGVAKIDIAYPQTNFPSNMTLLTFQFTFLKSENAVMTLNAASTYGMPNSLDYANSKKSFTIAYPITSSATTTSITTTALSSTSRTSSASSASSTTSTSTSTTTSTTSTTSSAGTDMPIPIYRFYKPSTRSHLYTVSIKERDKIIATLSSIYTYEGQRGLVLPKVLVTLDSDTVAVHRFFKYANGSHRYITNPTVVESWKKRTTEYKYEGVLFNAYKTTLIDGVPTALPFYEFYNTSTGAYFYTSSEREKTKVDSTIPEMDLVGIPLYVLK